MTGFNPRPPLKAGGANQARAQASEAWFQSAPAVEGGRCRIALTSGGAMAVFQSAPTVEGGRCGLATVLRG
jgi:hypothetical protein